MRTAVGDAMAFAEAVVIYPVAVAMGDDLRGGKYHVLVEAAVGPTRDEGLAGINPREVPHGVAAGGADVKIDNVVLVPLVVVGPGIVGCAGLGDVFVNGHQREVHALVDPVRERVNLPAINLVLSALAEFPFAHRAPVSRVGLEVRVHHVARAADLQPTGRPTKVRAREHPVHLRLGVPHDLVVSIRRAMRHGLAAVVGLPVDAVCRVAQCRRVRAQVGVAHLVSVGRVGLVRVDVKRGGVVMCRVQALQQRDFLEMNPIDRLRVAIRVAAVPHLEFPLIVQHRAIKVPLENRLAAILLHHRAQFAHHPALLRHHPVIHQKLLAQPHLHSIGGECP